VSAEAAFFTRSWRVGTCTCTLSVPTLKTGRPAHACIEWDPSAPAQLSPAELRQYLAGRDAAVADLAREMGLTVAVIDL
jgi:hypothetical protein